LITRALAIRGALLVVCVAGCKPRPPAVTDEMRAAASECGQAADIYFTLRAAAGDYDRNEADRRSKEALDDLGAGCALGSTKQACCASGVRLRTRISPGHLANCEDFYKLLREGGCLEM
jgi:hypothetical protein